jgi:hypothetical protein
MLTSGLSDHNGQTPQQLGTTSRTQSIKHILDPNPLSKTAYPTWMPSLAQRSALAFATSLTSATFRHWPIWTKQWQGPLRTFDAMVLMTSHFAMVPDVLMKLKVLPHKVP